MRDRIALFHYMALRLMFSYFPLKYHVRALTSSTYGLTKGL